MSAASLRTVAGSVIVTGAGRRLAVGPVGPAGPPADDSAMVTVLAADGIWLAADRGGCQATHASTRMTGLAVARARHLDDQLPGDQGAFRG